MSAGARIADELAQMGIESECLRIAGLGGDQAVVFPYPVEVGRFRDKTYQVGVAFQESAYPEYAPHFVWVADLPEPRVPEHSSCQCGGVRWAAFSVPPSDFWDVLPSSHKNMRTYLEQHLPRFWRDV